MLQAPLRLTSMFLSYTIIRSYAFAGEGDQGWLWYV